MRKNWKKLLAFVLVLGLVAASVAVAGQSEVTGKIEKSEQGIVIMADSGDAYLVMGKDLSEMVGKTVTAKGTLAEDKSGKTITVMSVVPVQE
jgi:hypothetical protein